MGAGQACSARLDHLTLATASALQWQGFEKRAQSPTHHGQEAPPQFIAALLGTGGDTTKAVMQKIQHLSNNGVLGAPAGWAQAELPCGALPITRTHVGDLPAVVSYWRPSVEELAVLNTGGSIALWVLGSSMPPVNLSIEGA